MGFHSFKLFIFSILFAAVGSSASAREYSPQVLHKILDDIRRAVAAGIEPAVVFDLDDTVLMATTRQIVIIREFAMQTEIQREFPAEAQKVLQLANSQLLWGVPKTFRSLGIANERFIKLAEAFWYERYFSNDYVVFDAEIPGASDYLRAVEKAGARIIYVSGRNTPNMREGTLTSLKRRNFPYYGPKIEVITKPQASDPDIEFKRKVFSEIAARTKVVAAFENEPENANAYFDYFPEATVVFVDSFHSDKPIEVSPRAQCIKDLLGVF